MYPHMLKAEQAEGLLGVRASRLKELCRAGKNPGAQLEPTTWLIPAATELSQKLTRGYEAGEHARA